ncbi:MAG: AAA family ATPase [Microscillaceae bacterium]|nr:AAA family ATPase [Microscillaceae bacterium]
MQKVYFPYGISNIEQLITQKYVFVDKTNFLPELEYEKFSYFLRPRKFGKSLFLSVLEYYYDVSQKDKFEAIFGNTYIGKNPTPLANSFRILKFDFSGIDTRTLEDIEENFTNSVKAQVEGFLDVYGLFSLSERERILTQKNAGDNLKQLFQKYRTEKLAIYILIDEYDHFTNEILTRSLKEFRDAVAKNGYVRKFYENIKIATQSGIVDRFFITGVSPMTLDGFTSGFNIATQLSHHYLFHNMMGFTHEEVAALLELVLVDKDNKEKVMQDLRDWYNGYQFSLGVEEKIYNANMVLYFLKDFQPFQKYPRQMLDGNIHPDYGKLKAMFEVANYQNNLEVLQEILEKGELTDDPIYQFNFESPFGRTEFVNFLYYLGNLTFKSEGAHGVGAIYQIPNYVIAELYWKYYAHILQNRLDFAFEEVNIKQIIYALLDSNEKPFLELIEQSLKALSNRDFQRFDEKHIKMLIIAYATMGNAFYVLSERETQQGGYTDIELWKRPGNTKTHTEYIFEVKYIKKEEENTFEAVKEKALTQLKGYLQDKVLLEKPLLRAFVLIFVKDSLFVEELIA